MIKVLIIEDNLEKLRAITNFLNQVCNINDVNISYSQAINGGRDFLMRNQYDLLLLDLVLPVNEGDDPSAENGINFLDEIHYNPNINIPIHIIGLTEFDSVFKEYYVEFEDKLWSLINFNLQNRDWTDKLKTKIFYLQNYRNKFEQYIASEKKYDIAIITALNIEFENLQKTAKWSKLEIEDDVLLYYTTTVNTKSNNIKRIIACCVNQMGMHATSAVASKIMAVFSPKQIFITGICGGIKESGINLGDLIVATQCWDYESGKIIENENGGLIFKPDMRLIPTDHGMIAKLTDFTNSKRYLFEIYDEYQGNKPNTHLNVFYGSVGSGPYVLSSSKYLENLVASDRKLLGIDMEGFGIYKAAQYHPRVTPVFIKAVSDFGDKYKHDNYQNYAAFVSAKLAMNFIYNTF